MTSPISLTADEAGYSLVEVMVAIVVLTVAIMPMVGMFDAALRAAGAGGDYDEARACAVQKLEEAKSLPYETVRDGLPAGSCEHSGFGYTVVGQPVGTDLRDGSGDEGLSKLTVTVSWDGELGRRRFLQRGGGCVQVVRAGVNGKRFLGEQDGFTLVEVLVSATMTFAVLFALYSIFDVSVKAFGYGGDRLEAVENARLAMGKMEREIRAAYPYDPTSDPPKRYLFLDPADPTKPAVPTATRVVFGNELGENGKIDASEVISYYLDGRALKRSKGGSVQTLVPSVPANGLRFTYCSRADECPPALAVTDEAEIRIVRIELVVEVGRAGAGQTRQTLTTEVYLRNRGGRG